MTSHSVRNRVKAILTENAGRIPERLESDLDKIMVVIEQTCLGVIGRGVHTDKQYLCECDFVAQEAINEELKHQKVKLKLLIKEK